MLNSDIKSVIDKLWNNFWSGGISNPLSVIEQISYLLFIKRLDDMDNNSNKNCSSFCKGSGTLQRLGVK